MVESILCNSSATIYDNWIYRNSKEFERYNDWQVGFIAHAYNIDAISSATNAIGPDFRGFDQRSIIGILPRDLWRHKHLKPRKDLYLKEDGSPRSNFIVRNKMTC